MEDLLTSRLISLGCGALKLWMTVWFEGVTFLRSSLWGILSAISNLQFRKLFLEEVYYENKINHAQCERT